MEENSKPTQCERIVEHMRRFGSITQFQAFKNLGIMRLASRISEMRKNGIEILSETVVVKNRFGEKCKVKKYFLKGAA